MAIVTAFAGQAAMAINGVKLVQELQAGRAELARKVDELEALREVGEAVSSSLDLDRGAGHDRDARRRAVRDRRRLDHGVRRARAPVPWCAASTGPRPRSCSALQEVRIELDTTLVGRAAKERRPIAVPDLERGRRSTRTCRSCSTTGGGRWWPCPMLREDRIVGSLVVRRKMTGDFTEETLDLLETFASQSALALLNAQLFRDTGGAQRASWRSPAGTSRSSWRACRTSCARRSTPCSASPRCSSSGCSATSTRSRRTTSGTSTSSGKHLLELLNEILDLSKVEAGQMELEFAVVDVPAVLEYAASMLRERAAAHSITLRVEVGDDVGEVEVDELRFRQVVLNLVSNAVKFTPDGGTVVVRAREVADRAAGVGRGHRRRHPGGRPGADLRVVPAGWAWRVPRGGHRPRPDALAPDRRAARRPDVARERSGGGQHVRVRVPRPPGRSEVAGHRADDRARPPSSSSRTTAVPRPADRVPVRGVDHGRDGPRRPVRPRGGPPGSALGGAARHPDARHRRLGGPARR